MNTGALSKKRCEGMPSYYPKRDDPQEWLGMNDLKSDCLPSTLGSRKGIPSINPSPNLWFKR
jgi:hypothetical protein